MENLEKLIEESGGTLLINNVLNYNTDKKVEVKRNLVIDLKNPKLKPFKLSYITTLYKDGSKRKVEVNSRHDLDVITFDKLNFLNSFEERLIDELISEVQKKDPDAIKAMVSEGPITKEQILIRHLGREYVVDDFVKEQHKKEIDETTLNLLIEEITWEVLSEHRKFNNNEVPDSEFELILYGEVGNQISSGLKNKGIADVEKLDDQTYKVDIKFIIKFDASKNQNYQLFFGSSFDSILYRSGVLHSFSKK